jgi:hypothetical protein
VTTAEARAILAEYIEEQARWRDEKVAEYPKDDRNAASARALRNLAHYVRALPDTDKRLEALAEIAEYVAPAGLLMPGEEGARLVPRYGFHQPTDPEWRPESESEFLGRFVAMCRAEAGAFSVEQLDEAASSEGAREALEEFEDR